MFGFSPLNATPLAAPSAGVSVTVLPTGVSATGSVGTVTIKFGITVHTTGVYATGAVGTATASAAATAYVTGVSATVYTTDVLVWGQIVPVTSIWTEAAEDSQTYTPVSPASNTWTKKSGYTDIAA